jgi:hypothetical protein
MPTKLCCTYLEEAYELAGQVPGMPCDSNAPNNVSKDAYQSHCEIWKHKQEFYHTSYGNQVAWGNLISLLIFQASELRVM